MFNQNSHSKIEKKSMNAALRNVVRSVWSLWVPLYFCTKRNGVKFHQQFIILKLRCMQTCFFARRHSVFINRQIGHTMSNVSYFPHHKKRDLKGNSVPMVGRGVWWQNLPHQLHSSPLVSLIRSSKQCKSISEKILTSKRIFSKLKI